MDSNEAGRHPKVGLKLEATVAPMYCGDFAFAYDKLLVGIERKGGNDLASSWFGGRLADQMRRMLLVFDITILLWEGMYPVTKQGRIYLRGRPKIKRSELSLWDDLMDLEGEGVRIRYAHKTDTASNVQRLREYYSEGRPHYLTRSKNYGMVERSRLMGFDGLGPTRERRLLEHFGTIRALASANVEEIAKVKGFGAKTAEHIWRQFNDNIKS